MLYLQPFGPGIGDFQYHREVIGDVIPADPDRSASGYGSIFVKDKIRGPATNIHQQGSLAARFPVQDHLGSGNGAEDDILHFEGELPEAADRVLHPVPDAMDYVIVRLQFTAQHAYGILDFFLTIHPIVADDPVQENIVRRNGHIAGLLLHFLDIVLGDLALIIRNAEHPAVVDAFQVGAGDGQPDLAHHDIAPVFSTHESVLQAGLGGFEVNDLPLPDPAGRGLPDTEDFDGAIRLGVTYHDTDFAGADFEPYENVGF